MFYKDLFASLCFIFFGIALATKHPYFFFGAMMCGAMSLSAKRKMWKEPLWAQLFYDNAEEKLRGWIDKFRAPKTEFTEEDEIKPLPPLDEK